MPQDAPASVSTPAASPTGSDSISALVRSRAWDGTSLGPAEQWPQSLRATLGLCLSSSLPCFLWWGPALVMLYNDAAGRLLDPITCRAALGLPLADGWPAGWPVLRPPLQHVIERGLPVYAPAPVPLRSSGQGQDNGAVTCSYSPVLDEAGAVLGVLGIIAEAPLPPERDVIQQLRHSEERYRSLTHMLTSVVWQTDAVGAFVTPQPEWAAFTGQEWEAHRGWGWMDALHPDDREQIREQWQRSLATGAPYESRGRIRCASADAYHHFVSQAVPLRHPDGTIREWIGTFADVHEQELRARDNRFLADLAERIRLATDGNELLDEVTQAICTHLHVRRCLVADIDVPNDHGVVIAEHCRGVPPVPREYRVSAYSPLARAQMSAGKMIVNGDAKLDPRTAAIYAQTYEPVGERAYVAVPLMRDGQWNGTMWVSDDVPRPWEGRELALLETVAERVWLAVEKLRAEESLRAHAARLGELYAAAQDAISVRDQFLSVASHELKTPLTALLGYSQTLLRRVVREGTLAERDQRILRQTAEQALRLNRLIDALLDATRIESGRLSIERAPLDLGDLLSRCVEALAATLEQHRLVLSGAAQPLPIEGDELRLEQVIQNLLGNAVKYSPAGGTVWITLGREGDEVVLTVRDEGVGIPPAAIPQLFQRFYRVDDDATRHIAGMGIGLYVVKEIVALHGGTIGVESTEGKGSSFTVRLPTGHGADAAAAAPLAGPD